jgi:hypothetical protein
MFRITIITSIIMIVGPSLAETYTVDSWPQGIAQVPCSAWTRNSDGGWHLNDTIKAGPLTLSGSNFNQGAQWQVVEKKCASK